MEIKNKITSKFNKENFALLNCGKANDGDWNGIDEYIRDFIKKLNESEHISTLFSCEGHKEGDIAYLFFNVSENGWDIFWQKLLPELSHSFSKPTTYSNGLYLLKWYISTNYSNNKNITTGISIYAELTSFTDISWENKKERFWGTVKELFLKYYINV